MRENRSLVIAAALVVILYCILAVVTANFPLTPTPTKGSTSSPASTPLGISFVSPDGDVTKPTAASVAFNCPMVSVNSVGTESPTGPIAFSPPIEGTYCWVGQAVLTFQPKGELPIATNFTAAIPAGTQALTGERLPGDYVWNFSTPALSVVRYRLEDRYSRFVPKRPELILEFNEPIEPEAVKKCSALLRVASGEEAQLDAARPDEALSKEWPDTDHTVVLTPASELPHGTTWQWVLLADLVGKAGPRPLGQRWICTFDVCPAFIVKGIKGFAESSGNTGIRIYFSNPLDTASISRESLPFKVSPAVKISSAYQDYEGYVMVGSFETEHEYEVTIPDSVMDTFGNKLSRQLTYKTKLPDYEPGIFFGGYRGYVERIGPVELSMALVNLPLVGVELFKIEEGDVVPYLKEEEKEGQRAWPEAHSRTGVYLRITGTSEEEKFKRVSVPLRPGLGGDEGGFLFLRARARLPGKKIVDEDHAFLSKEAVLQITDIGVTCKASPENTLIWTTSLHTGQPLPSVSLSMRNIENKITWQGSTDARGIAIGPGVDTSYGAKPTFLIAKNGGDLAYLALDKEQIGLWEFNVSRDWDPTPHRTIAHIFTDRGLYRAGETVHVKGIVRVDTEKGIQAPEEKSVLVTVNDSRGRKVLSRTMSLSDLGTFDFDIKLKESAALGEYWVSARLTDHPESDSGSGGFQVAAFRAAEFEVEIAPERKEYVWGDELQARVDARYLFGAPMKEGKIAWHAYWGDAWFTPAGCAEFWFGDVAGFHDQQAGLDREIESGEQELGADGSARVAFRLEPKGRVPCTLWCNLSVTATDRSHQSVSGSASVMLHPAEFYLGAKKHSYILNAKEPVQFQFIAARPDGQRVGDFPIKVRVIRRQWHTVMKKTVWSQYHYESEPVDETIASTTLQMTEQGATWSFVPPSSGAFFVEISAVDSNDRIARTVTHFYATGTEYVSWQRDDKNTVDLVADRDRYAVGGTARVLVKSPWEKAKAILTIERQGIMESRLLDLDSTAPTVEIPIKREYMPNVYVSMVLVQGRTSDKFGDDGGDLGKPTYRAGYLDLQVCDDAARLAVEVSPDRRTAQPGEKITVNVRVADREGKGRKAEVVLIAADEGVLKLIGYQTPDPLATIFEPRSLAVVTSETRRSVIGRTRFDWLGRKGAAAGDGAEAPCMPLMAGVDLFRKKFFYTAYYNPALMTDENGRASATFELPDNLTRFRLMGVAVSAGNLFGSGESDVEVKKPILIRPALPRFANAGDKFLARAIVHNYTNAIQKISAGIETEGQVKLAGNSTMELILTPDESAAIEFPVQISDPGEATLRFFARAGEYADGVETAIPVNYPAPCLTMIKEGSTDAAVTEPIRPPEAYRTDLGQVEVTISATRLCELGEGISYLLRYPYGCIEQTSSTTLVLAALKHLLPAISSSGIAAEDVDEKVEHGIHRILSMQTYDGGFSYWPGSSDTNPWASAYAAYTLLACQRAGYDVPKDEFKAVLDYLAGFLRSSDEYNRYADRATRCMMLYTLACAGRPEPAYHDLFSREAGKLPVFAKAFLAMAIHEGNPNDPLLAPLLADLSNYADGKAIAAPDQQQAQQLASVMDSDTRTTAIVLSAFMRMDPKSERIGRIVQDLMRRRAHGRWMSTQENAFCLLALADYVAGGESTAPDFSANVKMGDRFLGGKRFSSKSAPALNITIPLAEVAAAGSALTIEKEGQGTLFYTVKTRFLPLQTDRPPADNGFRIVRRYEPYEGGERKVSQQYKAGDLVKVHLTIATCTPRQYVAVEDPLPAGLEAVNTSFVTTEAGILFALREGGWSHFDYTEKRDDKVLLFADWLPAGVHEHVYVARATTPGTFALPAAHAEEMYAPAVSGESESSRFVIEKGIE